MFPDFLRLPEMPGPQRWAPVLTFECGWPGISSCRASGSPCLDSPSRTADMRLNPSLLTAAFLGAVSLNLTAAAQAPPTPPPAGVKPVPRRLPPVDQPPQQQPPAAAAQPMPPVQPEVLPQIPENPIRLEEQSNLVPPGGQPVAPPVVVNGQIVPQQVPVATRPPVKPKGPVYYYPVEPYRFPANAAVPPAMHVPNSPLVEDLSVDGDHGRYTYYSYRRPWYTPGHLSANVTIVW